MKTIHVNRLLITLLFGSCALYSQAQDVHFSQMPYSPLTLNPALAGANSPLQAIVNYRTQWRSVASPYKTIAASVDGRINENKRGKHGHIAYGLNFFNDQAGDARVSTTNVNLSVGYHIILDKTSTLGAAIYGGFGQRGINAAAGKWGSQYNGMAYDPTLSSGETFATSQFSYADFGAGLVYTYKEGDRYMTANDQKSFNYGFAIYHLNKPKYSFLGAGDDEELYMRWSIFANGNIGLGNSRWSIVPGVYYQRQKSAQELLVGTYFKCRLSEASRATGFNKSSFLSLGLFYRNKDALVAKAMFEWADYSVGFAYDVNTSSLTEVSNARGGVEFFLRYNMTGGFGGSRSRI